MIGVVNQIREFIHRYLVLSPEQEVACTLWVLHTWAFESATATPYLIAMSATKQSGKTRLLEVLECLVRSPLRTSGMSEAAMFRLIEQEKPTILLDEVDAIFGSISERTEPLRGVLNAGNRDGGSVARCVPPNWDVQKFSVFAPKALAGIDNGRWPDTLLDRSIVMHLKRRTNEEEVVRFRWKAANLEAEPLRVAAEQWADDHIEALADAEPAMPDELSDRACDAWEPLLAIADALGESWPTLARDVAASLFHRQQDLEDASGVLLLGDIRAVFDWWAVDKLASKGLCAELRKIEDRPWLTWGRGGVTPHDVAALLRPFAVAPRVIRISNSQDRGSTARGYVRADFEDAFRRYLPDVA